MLSHADTCEYYDKGYFVRNGKSERVSLTRTDIRIALSKKGVSASFIPLSLDGSLREYNKVV